jgi:hypothetical protein
MFAQLLGSEIQFVAVEADYGRGLRRLTHWVVTSGEGSILTQNAFHSSRLHHHF